MTPTDQITEQSSIDPRWSWLYTAGGVAGLVTAIFIPIQIIVFIVWPPPQTAMAYFSVFQKNWLIGLLNLDILLLVDNVLGIFLFLSLYVLLRRINETAMLIATVFGLLGIGLYVSSNTSLNMLSLSNQYTAATTEVQKAMFLAAGQAMLSIFNGTAFYVGSFLGTAALLIIAIVMLRSPVFSKATAYVGIVANVMGFGLFVPTTIGLLLAVLSVVGLEVWYIMIVRKLFKIGRESRK
jgi:hypothetical protein